MSITSDVARDIERVLRPLDGHGMYRNNAFRVTGLPTDATSRQVRRHREETQNSYYATPVPEGDVPLPPSDDVDELRAAFEVLRDPLARLVHELFWLWPDGPDQHDYAVFAHSRALEATRPDGSVTDASVWEDWRVSLRLWSKTLATEDTWAWVRRRASEIDDPRLSVSVLRALRDLLPEHVIGVSVGLAVRAADAARDDAKGHMAALRDVGFEPRQVRDVARAAVQPSADQVRNACETARSAPASQGLVAARDLLDETTAPLTTIGTVLSGDDLVGAVADEVAQTANNCVLGHLNELLETTTGPPPVETARTLLRRARRRAVSESVDALLAENLSDLAMIAEVARARGGYASAGRRAGSAGAPQEGEFGCVALLIIFLIGAVASWWFLYDGAGAGPVWSTVGAVVGGLTAVGLIARIVEFFRDF